MGRHKEDTAEAAVLEETTEAAAESIKEETPAALPAKTIRKTAAKKQPVLYVGPTLKNPPLIQNTVYSGIPAAAEEAMTVKKELKILFIPPENYSVAEEQIRNRKGAYYAAYISLTGGK